MSADAAPPAGAPGRLEQAIGEALKQTAMEFERAQKAQRFLTPAFPFVAKLYDHPDLAGLGALRAAEVVGPILERSFSRPGAPSPWLALGEFDSFGNPVGDPLAAFVDSWGRYRPSPLRLALHLAETEPAFIPELEGDAWAHLRRFASLCAYLSAARNDGPFPVSVRAFGEALGVDARTISNWRRTLERLGLLRQTTCAVPHKMAAEYVWLGPSPQRACPKCSGEGSIPQGPYDVHLRCPKCNGQGRI